MLPYPTIEAAELTLGRNLTLPERLWFSYSADKSDYFLYCHSILFLFVIFSLVPLPYVLAELRRIPGFDRQKIQPKVRLSLQELVRCYWDVMRLFFLVVGPLQLVSYPSVKFIGIRTGLPLLSLWEILIQSAVYFLVEDYTNYWIHRFLHCKWAHKKIHSVHHEFTTPISFAAPYAHWAEVLLLGIPSFLGPAIVPGHIITLWLWIALRQIEAIETHSGYDLPWTPTNYIPFYGGAEYHDYHHYVGGQSRSNFAVAKLYDYILSGLPISQNSSRQAEGGTEESNRSDWRKARLAWYHCISLQVLLSPVIITETSSGRLSTLPCLNAVVQWLGAFADPEGVKCSADVVGAVFSSSSIVLRPLLMFLRL